MAADDTRAELSSLATILEEATGRLAAIAEANARKEERAAAELFEIERALQSATRRLATFVRDLNRT